MKGITEQGGIISYYGNPAGYIKKDTAVVDRIFQTDELTRWLQSRNLTADWADGVMERLLSGEQILNSEQTQVLKAVRIWQLKPEVDIYKKFVSLDEVEKEFGSPDPSDYQVVYDGHFGTNDLEAIYTRCNLSHPPGYEGHSLSMSDVVELYDQNGSSFYYCDRFGFREIEFEEEQSMDMSMKQSF